ncbi:hypothetical protein RhiJN_02564 [Ceratobasidium sp. AG-Ba]|nr:hypothetical protein RhiJN_02564 [Ceratobasidium sp. AG-Ba]
MASDEEFPSTGLRKAVDMNLPMAEPNSLREWCAEWRRLNAINTDRRDEFALKGVYTNCDGDQRRACIDFENNRVPPEMVPSQTADVDSVIMIVKDKFAFAPGLNLRYFMLQSESHTLYDDLHIPPVKVEDEHGESMHVFPHKVPNARFMEADPHMTIRICFPRLRRAAGRSVTVTHEEHAQLYDMALLPAAQATVPVELVGCWLHDTASEYYRAEDVRNEREAEGTHSAIPRGRRVQQTGRSVHSDYLNTLVAEMRKIVNKEPKLAWARSFFFVIEMRGLKDQPGSMHLPPEEAPVTAAGGLIDDSPRVAAVEQTLSAFVTKNLEPDSCFVDLGMNIRLPIDDDAYECPLPAADAHAAILSYLLGISLEECMEYVSGKGGYYQRDDLAGLKTVAGFRFRVPPAYNHWITYIQLYFSDKVLTYNLTLPHHAKRVTCFEVLSNFDKWRKHHFQPLSASFGGAPASQVMHMRLEVRTEHSQYPHVQLRIPDAILRSWMYVVAPEDFWGWKFNRLTSIYSLLRKWINARAALSKKRLAKYCSLLVTLVWMANALVNRPDDTKQWKEVRDASSVHEVSEQGELVPVWPLNAHFLHSLYLSNARPPRMSGDRLVSLQTLMKSCGVYTEDELSRLASGTYGSKSIDNSLTPPAVEASRSMYPRMGANRRKTVQVRSAVRMANPFDGLIQEDEQNDSDQSAVADYEERPRATPRSRQLADIFSDLPAQMFAKAPVSKTGASWCMLEPGSTLITPDIFAHKHMLDMAFPSRIVFYQHPTKWSETVEILLPTIVGSLKDGSGAMQGVHCLNARKAFVTLQEDADDPEEREHLVQLARSYVNNHWAWLPFGKPKNRLWATGVCKQKDIHHVGPIAAGPWIVLNPNLW